MTSMALVMIQCSTIRSSSPKWTISIPDSRTAFPVAGMPAKLPVRGRPFPVIKHSVTVDDHPYRRRDEVGEAGPHHGRRLPDLAARSETGEAVVVDERGVDHLVDHGQLALAEQVRDQPGGYVSLRVIR